MVFSFKPRAGFLLPVLAALALAGCSRQESAGPDLSQQVPADEKPATGDWVVQEDVSDPDTLNPITAQDDNSQTICGKIFDSMLFQNRTTLKFEPNLASSYEISPDGMVYTFHLRHDVKWQDGQPFTADDVKFTYDRIQDPLVDCAFLRIYYTNIKSCEVLDPYTVRFTASERYFKTLECLGWTNLQIIPKHCFSSNSAEFNTNSFGRHPIGTGPYEFVGWNTGSRVELKRSPNYWGPTAHYPDRIVYQIIQDPSVSVQLLKKGELDVLDGIPPLQWEREMKGSRSMDRLQKIVYPFPSYVYLGFNLRKPLFADVRVRRAIDLLMPRKEILKKIYLGEYATTCSGYDPQSSPNYNHDVPPTPEDAVLAAKLLDEAGWKNDHGDGILYKDNKPLSFTVLYPSGSPGPEKMVELMQESLHQAGVDLKLERLEFVQLIDRTEDWKFDATLASWALDIDGDPYQIWDGSQGKLKRSSNFIGYDSPVANKLIAEGRLEYDQAKRAVIFRHLQQVIHDDYPVCFLFTPRRILLVSKRFQDIKIFCAAAVFRSGIVVGASLDAEIRAATRVRWRAFCSRGMIPRLLSLSMISSAHYRLGSTPRFSRSRWKAALRAAIVGREGTCDPALGRGGTPCHPWLN